MRVLPGLAAVLLGMSACGPLRHPAFPPEGSPALRGLPPATPLTFARLRDGVPPAGDRFQVDAYVAGFSDCPPCPPRSNCKTCERLSTVLYLSEAPPPAVAEAPLLSLDIGIHDGHVFVPGQKYRFELGPLTRDRSPGPPSYEAPLLRYRPLP